MNPSHVFGQESSEGVLYFANIDVPEIRHDNAVDAQNEENETDYIQEASEIIPEIDYISDSNAGKKLIL